MTEKRRRTYFPTLEALKKSHIQLFDNKDIVLSCREQKVAYAVRSPASFLTIQSRCPYNRLVGWDRAVQAVLLN